MSIFNFIGYTLTEPFRKSDNWRQIYKQRSSTFYKWNDVKCVEKKKLLGRHNKVAKWLFNYFFKNTEAATSHLCCSIKNLFFENFRNIHRTNRKTPVLESLLNSEYCGILKSIYFEENLRKAASKNVFIKLRKIKSYS